MKIGILGGTFDPIHTGHLIIGEYARISMGLDKVVFIPCGTHPFKNKDRVTSNEKRCEMIELAIKSNPYFEISTMEMERTGVNYTIDTIKNLKKEYKNSEIYFIIGSDILFQIEKWKDFEELFKMCKFILFHRIDEEKEEILKKTNTLKKLYNMNIEKIEAPIFPISSSEIRERIKKGLSIKYLVKEEVEKYILKNNLYKEKPDE